MHGNASKGALLAVSCAAMLFAAGLSATSAGEAPLDVRTGLPTRVIEDAAVWSRFVDEACGMSPVFRDANSVRRALKTSAAYQPQQLESGEIAFVALIALEDPRFVNQIRSLAQDPQWRAETTERLLIEPEYALDIPGAEPTALRATEILIEQGRRVYESGRAVERSAYSVQHSAWSRHRITDRQQRLALVRKLSSLHYTAKPEEEARLVKTLAVLEPDDGPKLERKAALETPPVSPAVTRGLALAALAVLGHARDGNGKVAAALLDEKDSGACLQVAKLNLYQCLAVARPRYEDIYCLGEHGLRETGQCIAGAAVSRSSAHPPAESARLDRAEDLYVRKDYWPPRQ
jgi:hypothetical protein